MRLWNERFPWCDSIGLGELVLNLLETLTGSEPGSNIGTVVD